MPIRPLPEDGAPPPGYASPSTLSQVAALASTVDFDTLAEIVGRSVAYEDTTVARTVFYAYLLEHLQLVPLALDWIVTEERVHSWGFANSFDWLLNEGTVYWVNPQETQTVLLAVDTEITI